MSVPIMVSIGEDALKAVPDSYREAALARGRHPLADRLPGADPGGEERPAGGGAARRGPRRRRDHGRADGHRARRQHPQAASFDPVRTLTATIAAELGEASRGSRPLPGAVRHRHPAVHHHLRRQPDRRPRRAAASARSRRAMPCSPRPALGQDASGARELRRQVRSSASMALAMVVPLLLIVGLPGLAGGAPALLGLSRPPTRRAACAGAASGRRCSARSTW